MVQMCQVRTSYSGVASRCVLHTSFVCPSLPAMRQNCSSFTEAPLPSIMSDSVVLCHRVSALASCPRLAPPLRLLCTDSTKVVRELRRINSSLTLTCGVHRLLSSFPCPVRILWPTLSQMVSFFPGRWHTRYHWFSPPRGSLSSFTRILCGAPRVTFSHLVDLTILAV